MNLISLFSVVMILIMCLQKMRDWGFHVLFMMMMLLLLNFSWNSLMWLEYSLDVFNLLLLILVFWLGWLMNMTEGKDSNEEIKIILVLMTLVLMLCFMSDSLMLFYVYFEASLIPLIMLIYKKGYSPERFMSGVYLLLYTLGGSLPLLLVIVSYIKVGGSSSIFLLGYIDAQCMWVYFVGFLAFLVKLPMFGFHLWLPKAHVEAPLVGSMVLAGVLLKLGGYGIYRLLYLCKNLSMMSWMIYIISVSMVGGVYVAMICVNQFDIKMLIAYSSVVHMSLIILGSLSGSAFGVFGSMFMMLSHGFCSSGLFYMANIIYERVWSRNLFMLGGIGSNLPVMIFWWAGFMAFNMGCPPSMNFFSEISLFLIFFKWSFYSLGFLVMFSLFGAIYNLYMFTFINHGKSWFSIESYFKMSEAKEFLIISVHFFPLILYLLDSNMFLLN